MSVADLAEQLVHIRELLSVDTTAEALHELSECGLLKLADGLEHTHDGDESP